MLSSYVRTRYLHQTFVSSFIACFWWLNKEIQKLSEEDKKELDFYTSLKGKNLSEEIEKTKKQVLDKLQINLNESTDSDLKDKIQKTINKINESKQTLTSLYKLKQLEKGLWLQLKISY